MKKIGIIISSTRPGRRSPSIAEWFAKNLPQAELTYDIIDLAAIILKSLKWIIIKSSFFKKHTT